jgi:predicted amidophosphoribosyltransferase
MSIEIVETCDEQQTQDGVEQQLICIVCNNSFEFWEGHICECRCDQNVDIVLSSSSCSLDNEN